MRRLQSSVQLLERQRNPGVGYWSAGGSQTPRAAEQGIDSRSSIELHRRTGKESQPATPVAKDVASPAPSDVAQRHEEEEVNLEVRQNKVHIEAAPADILVHTVLEECHITVFGEQGDARESCCAVEGGRDARCPAEASLLAAKSCTGLVRDIALHAPGITSIECQAISVDKRMCFAASRVSASPRCIRDCIKCLFPLPFTDETLRDGKGLQTRIPLCVR
jgi:hypothetical protein